jgi:hypothetical protein
VSDMILQMRRMYELVALGTSRGRLAHSTRNADGREVLFGLLAETDSRGRQPRWQLQASLPGAVSSAGIDRWLFRLGLLSLGGLYVAATCVEEAEPPRILKIRRHLLHTILGCVVITDLQKHKWGSAQPCPQLPLQTRFSRK